MTLPRFQKLALKFIVCFFAFLLCAVLLLSAAYSLPTETIDANVASSAAFLESEGEYIPVFTWCSSKLDNFTDSLMLLMAAEPRHGSSLESSMLSLYSANQDSPYFSLIDHYLYDKDMNGPYSYSRYWHGYLVFLKPLLMITDYEGIRLINSAALLLLMAVLFLVLLLKKKYECIIPLGLCILLANPLVIRKSLQYSSCFYLILIVLLLLLILEQQNSFHESSVLVFLFLGMGTSFLDLLTYPLATYCVPAVMYMYLCADKKACSTIINIIKTGFAWCFGFAGMWVSKWIVGSIVLKENLFVSALSSAKYRTSREGVVGVGETIALNLKYFCDTPFIYLTLIFVLIVVCVSFVILLRRKESAIVFLSRYVLPYSVSVVLPFMWYAVLHNHSAIHHFFTNKALLGTAFGLLTMATDLAKNYIGIRFKKLHS